MKSLIYVVPVLVLAGAWFFYRDVPKAWPPVEQRESKSLAAQSAGLEDAVAESRPDAGAISLRAASSEDEVKSPFLVKVHVRRIFTGWQRLESAQDKVHRRGLRGALRRDVDAIKARLYSDGLFTETALRKHMLEAAKELGYRPEEARFVVNKVLAVVRAEEAAQNPEPHNPHSAPAGLPLGL